MMQGQIVTSRLLMDLEEVARRERMTPLDPWQGGPEIIPEDCHDAVVLRLDGTIERVPDPCYTDPDWSTIAGIRYEDPLGNEVDFETEADWEDY